MSDLPTIIELTKKEKLMQIEVILKDGSSIYPIYDPTSISREQLRDFYSARFAEGLIIGWGFVE